MADSWHIAHLTDPHLTENQQTLYGGSIDPWGQLRQTFEALSPAVTLVYRMPW
ncbi:hypothetical protein [Auritidibacter sp. NML120636]|uniref:hypothetical protein n=1 Tax=Auritidibacter sp. NML120636 TaxID=2170743 RepID=UPI001314E9FC|nr:hypothetical protein [Auritidibacter sp. NML120636]